DPGRWSARRSRRPALCRTGAGRGPPSRPRPGCSRPTRAAAAPGPAGDGSASGSRQAPRRLSTSHDTSPGLTSARLARGDPSLEEVLEQPRPFVRQEAFRVILDAFQGIPLVADAHDLVLVGPGHDREVLAQRPRLDHQAVVAGGLEGVREPLVDPPAIV